VLVHYTHTHTHTHTHEKVSTLLHCIFINLSQGVCNFYPAYGIRYFPIDQTMEVTLDDLRYDLKCMTQKYEILDRNYNILLEERAIEKGTNGNSGNNNVKFLEEELVKKNTGKNIYVSCLGVNVIFCVSYVFVLFNVLMGLCCMLYVFVISIGKQL
jgi:hypothetical protein